MKIYFFTALKMFVFLSIVCGIIYPLLLTTVANVFFPFEAQGSLIHKTNGRIVGSALIGQKFMSDRFFQGRPSITDYATIPSGASNLSPTSLALKDVIDTRKKAFGDVSFIPTELLMASGSGLDPHITLEGALFQAKRVASARGISELQVKELIEGHILGQIPFGKSLILVNVLELNLALEGEKAP